MPSEHPSITSIKAAPKKPGQVIVRVGTARVATLAVEQAVALGLSPGQPWTAALAARVAEAGARHAAFIDATRMLARRLLSTAQLLRKLALKDHSPANARAVADDLANRGLLDDARFAAAFSRTQLRARPTGRRLIEAKLARAGVPRDTARAALNETLADAPDPLTQATDMARRKADRARPDTDPMKLNRRLLGMLARRGYDPDVCLAAVRAATAGRPASTAPRPKPAARRSTLRSGGSGKALGRGGLSRRPRRGDDAEPS